LEVLNTTSIHFFVVAERFLYYSHEPPLFFTYSMSDSGTPPYLR